MLVTGDISDNGSAESYAAAKIKSARLGLLILPARGNHDDCAAFANLPGMCGNDLTDWVINIRERRIVAHYTLVEGHGSGKLRTGNLQLLPQAIAGAQDGRSSSRYITRPCALASASWTRSTLKSPRSSRPIFPREHSRCALIDKTHGGAWIELPPNHFAFQGDTDAPQSATTGKA